IGLRVELDGAAEVRARRRERADLTAGLAHEPRCAEADVLHLRPRVALLGRGDLDAEGFFADGVGARDRDEVIRPVDDLLACRKNEEAKRRHRGNDAGERAEGDGDELQEPAAPELPPVRLGLASHGANLAVSLLGPLLVFLASDAQRRLGPRLEALHRNRLAAILADAERPVVDFGERKIDLLEKGLLASAEPELERL